MKIQTSTDYAIRILRHLHKSTSGLQSAMHIIDAIDMNGPLFSKITKRLMRDGFLCSIKGRKGGFHLAKPATEISIYDVLICIEGDLQTNHCPVDNSRCDGGETCNCKVYDFFNKLQHKTITHLSSLSIADLDL